MGRHQHNLTLEGAFLSLSDLRELDMEETPLFASWVMLIEINPYLETKTWDISASAAFLDQFKAPIVRIPNFRKFNITSS